MIYLVRVNTNLWSNEMLVSCLEFWNSYIQQSFSYFLSNFIFFFQKEQDKNIDKDLKIVRILNSALRGDIRRIKAYVYYFFFYYDKKKIRLYFKYGSHF